MAIIKKHATEDYVVAKADDLVKSVYSADNPPPYPVTSVEGQTGAISLKHEVWTFTLADGTVVTKEVYVK